jgi:hypothetical protein
VAPRRRFDRVSFYLAFIYLVILLIAIGAFIRWNDERRSVFLDRTLTSEEISQLAALSCPELREAVGMRPICDYLGPVELRTAQTLPDAAIGCPLLWRHYLSCAP